MADVTLPTPLGEYEFSGVAGTSGAVEDRSGNGNHLLYVGAGAEVTIAAGHAGEMRALSVKDSTTFSMEHEFEPPPTTTQLSHVTIQYWAKNLNVSVSPNVIGGFANWTGPATWMSYLERNGQVPHITGRFDNSDSYQFVGPTGRAKDTAWHNYAFVFDAATDKGTFYVDGVSVYSVTATPSTIRTNTSRLLFGGGVPPSGGNSGGTMSAVIEDLRVFDVALTADQVVAYMNVPVLPAPSPEPKDPVRVLNVVAHQDDDLYFLSPDILEDIDAATDDTPIGTFYLTMGDASRGWGTYAQGREAGVKAAWAQMAGKPNAWTDSTITLAGKTIATSTLNGTQIQLMFVRIADGGYPKKPQSNPAADPQLGRYLMKLWNGEVATVASAGPYATTYTKAELTAVIAAAIDHYGAQVVRHLNHLEPWGADHPDHTASARFADAGAQAATTSPARQGYVGYGNVSGPIRVGGQWNRKRLALDTYAPYDTWSGSTFSVSTQWAGHMVHATKVDSAPAVPGSDVTFATATQKAALAIQADATQSLSTLFWVAPGSAKHVALGASVYIPAAYASASAQHHAHLWTTTDEAAEYPDTYLAGGAVASVTPGTDARILFDRPVLLNENQRYWVQWFWPNGNYPAALAFFNSNTLASPNAPQVMIPSNYTPSTKGQWSTFGGANGAFATPKADNEGFSAGAPDSTGQAAWYGIEPIIGTAVQSAGRIVLRLGNAEVLLRLGDQAVEMVPGGAAAASTSQ